MTKHEQIALSVQTLAEIHRVQLTENAARAYLETLEVLTVAEIKAAEKAAHNECERMPPPAELLKLGRRSRPRPDETIETARRLEAMKPRSLPTAEELAGLRSNWKAWRDFARRVADRKDVNRPAQRPPSIHPGEAEAKQAIAELEARLKSEGTS